LLGTPLVVVLGENLHAVATGAVRDFDGSVIAAGDRLVGAEKGHRGVA
jgi:hypothetical protein